MFLGIGIEVIFIIGLASFRLTRLLVFDKITEFIRSPFFDEVKEGEDIYLVPKNKGMRRWIGEALNCYWCTGIWVSMLLLLGYLFLPVISIPLIILLAIAAVAGIIETVVSKWIGE
ncbi:DUF1360 domain-containing protein [Bacillus sp. B15-48]|uniref:DUF1360 domain-containing protein n=1 Tax=Bacillus sp. B15-48 TaxID=1548601 RepID=UPI00193EF0D3|nr:DUF1360 domain-containing protein [Bacillus sp. B15-48]MBM4764266.1 DUF1360 domain-containing protein [Bacillus sp. B15-48]